MINSTREPDWKREFIINFKKDNSNRKTLYRYIPCSTCSSFSVPCMANCIAFLLIDDKNVERVLSWKFLMLDQNADGYLDKAEYKELRRLAKKAVRPKKCARTFARTCDLNRDLKLSKQEWGACLANDFTRKLRIIYILYASFCKLSISLLSNGTSSTWHAQFLKKEKGNKITFVLIFYRRFLGNIVFSRSNVLILKNKNDIYLTIY